MEKKDSSKPPGKQNAFDSALTRASALCSRQEQSPGHIREKLKSWNVSDTDAEKILKKLYAENFLDDNRFAEMFTRDKFRLNGWGRIKIAYAMHQKGIGEDAIQHGLEQIDEDAYFSKCLELVRAKSGSLKDTNQFTRKGKLFKYAAGRGFEPDLIHRALSSLGSSGEE